MVEVSHSFAAIGAVIDCVGFNNISTLVGHFVLSPTEREKKDSRGDEREGQGRKRNRNESEEPEEITRGPRATTRSPEWNCHCRYADGMQHFSNTFMTRQWLKQFLRYLAYKVQMLKFSKRLSKKKVQIFFRSHLVHLLILSFKGFFFSIFSSGNHFVQQSRTILAILAKGHKRNFDAKLFWNLAIGHGDIVYYFEILPLAMEMSFKGFSIFSSGNHFVQQIRPILAILVKGDKRNISVKSFWNQATGQGGDV